MSEDGQKEQKPARRDGRGAEPPCQKSGTVVPRPVRPIFLFNPPSAFLFGGRSRFSLAIFKLGFRLVYQIKPQ